MQTLIDNLRRTTAPAIVLGAAIVLCGAAPAVAARQTKTPALSAAQLVPTLHRINQMEIDAGKVAQDKGASDVAKEYGATLERQHEAADDNLKKYASEAKLDLNGSVPPAVETALRNAQAKLNQLKNVQDGMTFDREFAEAMARDHGQAISLVDRARTQIHDPKLEALLGQIEPMLREHQQMADNLLASSRIAAAAASRATAQGRRPSATH
jgi:putative membrane protein